MKIKGLIFDFDGTLGDSRECGILATQKAFSEMELTIPDEETIAYYMGIPIERSFLEMANKPLSEEELRELIKVFRRDYQLFEEKTLKVFEGIPELLAILKEKGINCFVVSSKKTDVLDRNLKGLGIADYFVETIGSDKVSHYKPHPEGITVILANHALQKEEVLMIGDATFDIEMGKAAGVGTVAVAWGSHDEETLLSVDPDFFIKQPLDLLPFID